MLRRLGLSNTALDGPLLLHRASVENRLADPLPQAVIDARTAAPSWPHDPRECANHALVVTYEDASQVDHAHWWNHCTAMRVCASRRLGTVPWPQIQERFLNGRIVPVDAAGQPMCDIVIDENAENGATGVGFVVLYCVVSCAATSTH